MQIVGFDSLVRTKTNTIMHLQDLIDEKSNQLSQTVSEITKINSLVRTHLYEKLPEDLKDAILAQGHALALNRLALKSQISIMNKMMHGLDVFSN